MQAYKNIDEYIALYPKNVQAKLEQIRELVHELIPEAKEKIGYGIPTFVFHGNLVHFAAYDTHIGFYPGAGPIADYQDDLKQYETSKGTVRFRIDKPLPLDTIGELTKAAIERNLSKKK